MHPVLYGYSSRVAINGTLYVQYTYTQARAALLRCVHSASSHPSAPSIAHEAPTTDEELARVHQRTRAGRSRAPYPRR